MKTITITATFIFYLLFCESVFSQIIDIDYTRSNIIPHGAMAVPSNIINANPDSGLQILKSGFVNFLTNGSLQASANLLRINIGERDKFYIPFYIYTGTSGNAFGTDKTNQNTISNLLNPIGGTINLSFNGRKNIIKGDKVTSLQFAYQLGGRLINGRDSINQSNFNFFSGFANIGVFFQTGAWAETNPDNMGVFFLQIKAIGTLASKDNYQTILGDHNFSNSYLLGYSVDGGIAINKIIDLKFGVYQFTNNTTSTLLKNPVVNFSVNYNLK